MHFAVHVAFDQAIIYFLNPISVGNDAALTQETVSGAIVLHHPAPYVVQTPVIPGKPPSPVSTVFSVLAFRKHRCDNTPLT